MIADMLATLSVLALTVLALLRVHAEAVATRPAGGGAPGFSGGQSSSDLAAVGGPPALLVLTAAAQLGWSVQHSLLYVAAAAAVPIVLCAFVRRVVGASASLVIPVAAWTLTCLGAVTAERLYPDSGVDQARWAMVGVAAFLVAAWIGSTWNTTARSITGTGVAVAGCVALTLPLMPGIGVLVNGAPGWISVGPFVGQTGDLARILIIIGLGSMLYAAGPALRAGRVTPALLACWPVAFAAALGGYASDLGPVLVLTGAVAVMLIVCGPPPRVWIGFTAVGTVLVVATFFGVGKLRARIDQMLNPITSDGQLQNTGAALRSFATGGWLGTGFNNGSPLDVANVENDFVLAGIGEERGAIVVIAICCLFGALVTACWLSAIRATSAGPRLISTGLAAMVSVQALYVTLATINKVPVTGMVVPFLSNGGSSLTCMWIAVGLIVGIGSHRWRPVPSVPELRVVARVDRTKWAILGLWLIVITLVAWQTVVPEVPARTAAQDAASRNPGPVVFRDGTPFLVPSTMRDATTDADVQTRTLESSIPQLNGDIDAAYFVATNMSAGTCSRPWLEHLVVKKVCESPTMVTSLDSAVQTAARDGLETRGYEGDVVALDLKDGSILGLYSGRSDQHSYDAGYPAVYSQSAPGSTFKTIVAASALSAGQNTTTPVRDEYTPPGGVGIVHNAGNIEGGGDLTQALAESSNTAFAEIAIRTGLQSITQMTAVLSADSADFPTHPGIVVGGVGDDPDALARTGFGQQDVRASPYEMAVAVGRLATNGALPRARVQLGQCTDDQLDVDSVTSPPATALVLDDPVTAPVLDGMRAVVQDGHAGELGDLYMPVAAKTGTADDDRGSYDGWVVALAPAENPEIVIAVRILGGEQSPRSGAADAAPVAAEVAVAAIDAVREDIDPCRKPQRTQGK